MPVEVRSTTGFGCIPVALVKVVVCTVVIFVVAVLRFCARCCCYRRPRLAIFVPAPTTLGLWRLTILDQKTSNIDREPLGHRWRMKTLLCNISQNLVACQSFAESFFFNSSSYNKPVMKLLNPWCAEFSPRTNNAILSMWRKSFLIPASWVAPRIKVIYYMCCWVVD